MTELPADIVEQLRETRRMNVPYQLMVEAANEIERLRASVRWYAGVLSRTEISAAIAADAAMPEVPPDA